MRSSKSSQIKKRRRICVFLPGYDGYYGEVLRGIRRYGTAHPSWKLIFRGTPDPFGPGEAFDGVLGDLSNERAQMVARYAGPVVQVANFHDVAGVPRVSMDERAAGRVAAEHFLANGHRHFAFVGFERLQFSEERLAGYTAALPRSLDEVHVLRVAQESRWHGNVDEMVTWVRGLPTPLAILTCNDTIGTRLATALSGAGVSVPHTVAVVGVDNVGPDCEMNEPQLSSVVQPMESIGHTAAALLDRLIDGQAPPPGPILLPPAGVVVRESSDASAVADPMVREAVRFIRERLDRPISVEDVVEAVAVSRSSLERRFRGVLGRTPLAEIHRSRLERACQHLAQTEMPLDQIAELCGFGRATHLCNAFRQRLDTTPIQYRRQYRPPR